MKDETKHVKPLGGRAYGHIPHLPGSRMGPADHHIDPGNALIATEKPRDRRDVVVVQEKLDGCCMAVACIDGRRGDMIVPMTRAGYHAADATYEMQRMFVGWVSETREAFEDILKRGERLVGEWLIQAHGTRYKLPHGPFVAFDIMEGKRRLPYLEFLARIGGRLPTPRLLSYGPPMSIEDALWWLKLSGHGATDPVEGAVWRVERGGEVQFLAKYVRPEKVDGQYLPDVSGGEPVWNECLGYEPHETPRDYGPRDFGGHEIPESEAPDPWPLSLGRPGDRHPEDPRTIGGQ